MVRDPNYLGFRPAVASEACLEEMV
jgi:hypothetical protein